MNKGEGIKKGLKTLGWLVAFPVPVTKALATKQGAKFKRKAATIAATWAMYLGLATAGVAAMVPNNKPDDKVVDSVGYVVDDPDLIDDTETNWNPSGIIVQDHPVVLGVGEEMTVIANATPYNLPDNYAKLTWVSSDKSVATVDEKGKITGIGIGKATISVITINGIRKTFDITVAPSRTVPVTVSVTSDNETFNVDDWMFFLFIEEDMDHDNFRPSPSITEPGYVGDYTIVPGRRIHAYVTFNYRYKRNMDTGYASQWIEVTDFELSNGFEFVLPLDFEKGNGTSDFPDENIVVTVNFGMEHPEAEMIEIYGGTGNLQVGRSRPINYTVTPYGVDLSKLIWTSSDESIATVDKKGVVTGHKAGHVAITVTAPGGISDSVEFDVINRQNYNMTVQPTYSGLTDLDNWEKYYLVNGEILDEDTCKVTMGDELTFTAVFKKPGDDSVIYENSVTRTVSSESVSSGMDIYVYVNVTEDNGKGKQVEKEILARLYVDFE